MILDDKFFVNTLTCDLQLPNDLAGVLHLGQKDLGIIISPNLKWALHLASIVKRVNR